MGFCFTLTFPVKYCISGDSRFLATILTWTKRKPSNKKHVTEAVLRTKFHGTPSSHRKVRPHIRFLLHPLKTVRFGVAVERVLVVTCFRVVQTWKAWKVWKVIYSFQKSRNKTWMTVFLEEKKFVVLI